MNRFLLSLSLLLCMVHGQSIAQKAGDVRWTRLSDLSPGRDTIQSIKVQPDGKIVAAGNSYRGSNMVVAVGRFDQMGMPDTSFGGNGVVTASLDSAHTRAKALEIQPDGKIVVAGRYEKATGTHFLLARFNPNGRPDSSFGVNGLVLTDLGNGVIDFATALAIQTDGKIVAAGWTGSSSALCRYNTDGSLDSSFDLDGKLTIAASAASSVKLQRDGKIVVCCGSTVVRIMPDGSLDNSFGMNAQASLYNTANCMAIQSDGKMLFSGSGFVLERLDTAGVHDNSFGNGGVVTTSRIYPYNDRQTATSVCLQADGRILASGWAASNMNTVHYFAIARYQTNGAPDISFGTSGSLYSGSLPKFYEATSLSAAVGKNNELILAGINQAGYPNTGEWAMASYYLGPPLAINTLPVVSGKMVATPNPAEDFARIQATQIANGSWRLSLCDLIGRALYGKTVVVTNGALDKSISLIDLPAATYLVKLENGISRIAVKLVKSR